MKAMKVALYARVSTKDIRHSLHKVCELAGVPKIGWHGLRHSFRTWLAENNVDIERIARLMSHSNINSTRIYVHLAAQGLRQDIEKLPSLFLVNGESESRQAENQLAEDKKEAVTRTALDRSELLVDLRRIELLTSALRTQRSPS